MVTLSWQVESLNHIESQSFIPLVVTHICYTAERLWIFKLLLLFDIFCIFCTMHFLPACGILLVGLSEWLLYYIFSRLSCTSRATEQLFQVLIDKIRRSPAHTLRWKISFPTFDISVESRWEEKSEALILSQLGKFEPLQAYLNCKGQPGYCAERMLAGSGFVVLFWLRRDLWIDPDNEWDLAGESQCRDFAHQYQCQRPVQQLCVSKG